MTLSRSWRIGIACLVAISAIVGALVWNQDRDTIVIGDGPVYGTVNELVNASDLFLRGVVKGVAARYQDSAGEPERDERGDPIPRLPKVIVEIDVREVLEGNYAKESVHVVLADTTGTVDNWTPVLTTGEQIVIALFDVPADRGSPEVQEQDERFGGLFGVVGGKQGVFDIAGSLAVSRSETEDLTVDLEAG